jgi:Ca2+:H+ antiporter
VLALKLGEPFGSILLAVAVTVIEAGLIVSIMLAGAEGSERVARDTVFAAVMIVLNGVVGLCLVLGAGKHFEQTFQLQGAASALTVLGTLATLALILPNFAEAASGPSYSILQLEGVGLMSLVLWCVFVFVQTVKHRDYFLDTPGNDDSSDALHSAPSTLISLLSLALLMVSLAAIVLLAKTLSYPVDAAIGAAGLRTTVLQGAVHLVIFAAFMLVSAVP